ncbi:topoisomerase DNA-binding C4 zinc finger domain-containing protein [Geomonas sp. Red421]|uniref:Topoisomerase DNA-binding C4 zinc finger domain-containing protein n=1 Tax=Geomonas anaerohicana TaxID=2798583 RepID=A0ABS0YFF4_9BACT|nr:topoisomerase DNA-binding C4 zinc finger domain-containing protein [Geomonas anaerohicana]
MNNKCELCGREMVLRTRLSGDKRGHRYWVCSDFPRCKFTRFYAEQGKPGIWGWFLEKGVFSMKKRG